MTEIQLSSEEKALLVEQLQQYLMAELEVDIGQFDGEFLLDFFAKKMGVYFYNQGLRDAQAVLASRVELIEEAIDEIIQPVD